MIDSTTHRDEQSRFDSALNDPDRLLLDSLQLDERRRRRRRIVVMSAFLGGLIMVSTLTAMLAGWLTFATTAPTAQDDAAPPLPGSDAAIEQAEDLTAEGWKVWQGQKFADARTLFEQAVVLDPEFANAWNGLGWASFNGGDSEAAVAAFEKCVELEPEHPAALNGLGQVFLSWREYDKAEKFLTKAAPQAPAAWFGLGRLYLLTGNYAEAEKWIEKAQQSNPTDQSLQKMLAAAKQKELPDDLRRQIEPPGKPKAATAAADTARGWQQFNDGKFRSAERSFRRALAKDPEDAIALNGLGFCLLNNGKEAAAKEYFEKCLKLDPQAAGAMNGLARCLKAEGKIDEAITVWANLREKFPGPTAATYGLATTYLERGEHAKAVPLYEELVAAMPDNAEYRQGLEAAKAGQNH